MFRTGAVLLVALMCFSCAGEVATEEDWSVEHQAMVATIKRHGVRDARILTAMGKVQRHRFIPDAYRTPSAYGDHPCPIGYGQTISQPFIVAYMTEKLAIKSGEKVLEKARRFWRLARDRAIKRLFCRSWARRSSLLRLSRSWRCMQSRRWPRQDTMPCTC